MHALLLNRANVSLGFSKHPPISLHHERRQMCTVKSSQMRVMHMVDYGPPTQVFKLAHERIPKPTGSELLVQVRASSVNLVDCWIRNGYGKEVFETQRMPPIVLGRDCSGVVVDVGSNVWNFKIGDEIYAAVDPLQRGFLSEYALVKEYYASPKPKSISHAKSASLPYVGLTAWSALVDTAQVKENQSVLVMGASGGIGLFAVQLLKHLGCKVSGTCSSRHMDRLRSLGVDQLFDYKDSHDQKRLEDARFDVILDCVKRERGSEAVHLLNPGGHLVTVNGNLVRRLDSRGILLGFPSAFAELCAEKLVQKAAHNVHYDWAYFRADGHKLQQIAELVDGGHIKTFVDETPFTLEQTAQAHEYYESNKANGKVIIQISH